MHISENKKDIYNEESSKDEKSENVNNNQIKMKLLLYYQMHY